MKKQASDWRLVPRSGGRGRMEKSRVKHKTRAAFKVAPMGRWAGAGGGQSFFILKKAEATGKTVKIGHSCAAVTYHKPPSGLSGWSKANRATGEGEGRGDVLVLPRKKILGRRVHEKCGVRTSVFSTHRAGALCALATNLQRLIEGWG